MYDVIIIGGGAAGLSAAIYAARACLSTLLIEKQPMDGGQILNTYEVDNYPGLPGISGFELGQKLTQHAQKLGMERVNGAVERLELSDTIKKVVTAKAEYEAKAVILATGAGYRKLNVPGEERLMGMGVSYCATCDGAFFRGKTVAVVGGGDVALEDALFLARGCEKVYLIHRRDALRGAKILQEQVKETSNIEILWDSVVEEIHGEHQVEELVVFHKKSGEKQMLSVNGIFIAVGIVPNTDFLQNTEVALDENGYIVAGENGRTNVDGVYAAGDVRTKALRQVITAAADGANAVTDLVFAQH